MAKQPPATEKKIEQITLSLSPGLLERINKIITPEETLEQVTSKAINHYIIEREGLTIKRNVREYLAELHTQVSEYASKCDFQVEEISRLREDKSELQRKVKIERARANTSEAKSQKIMEKLVNLNTTYQEREVSFVDLNMRLEKLKKAESMLRNIEGILRKKLEAERPLPEREKWLQELYNDVERVKQFMTVNKEEPATTPES